MHDLRLHSLKHVSSAIEHAERLADEAEELGLSSLANALSDRSRALARKLDDALLAHERVPPAREARIKSHLALSDRYAELSYELGRALPPEEASRLTPGSHLDVAERARYRLRHLVAAHSDLSPLAARLQASLCAYDRAVDAYLHASADAAFTKERALGDSQEFRLGLERAKLTLLNAAETGSDAWRRIKRRAVRTRPARALLTAPASTPLLAA